MNVSINPAREDESAAPLPCRITVNPELTRMVFVAGELSVGFTFEEGVTMLLQARDALQIMAAARQRGSVQ